MFTNKTGLQKDFKDFESIEKEIEGISYKEKKEEEIRLEDTIIHMKNAYEWAKRRCYAERRKVGAVVVKNGRAISTGFNGTKPGHPNECEHNGVTKDGVTHAEKNAIFKLFDHHTETPKNSAIFVTTAPCSFCTEDLILSGISSIYFTEMYRSIQGVEELIKNGISVYHVNLKMIDEYDKETEKVGSFNYRDFPKDFITTIYKNNSEGFNVEEKISSIKKIREIFKSYEDGKYHTKFYNVSI